MAVRFGMLTVPCYKELNLLGHAQTEEIEIGSRCGGYGECGGDRIRITRGAEHLSPVTDLEREHLSAEDLAQGYRLGCQSFPQSDDAEIDILLEFATGTR